ncbi:hypothetical protein [Desulfosporosinus sp.]|uniref:hypothetical protein n=1 Tax=Desulfosporosinus sp. TaxID=157907 RepID=UPI0025BE3C9E|nr:hypothetical protein [Desulfosporosinus sp.]MBC2725475.1 hypothetical protein [Desulfosporosinus sp.]
MRIERIRINNSEGLGDIDWIFPLGPVLLTFKDPGHQRLFRDLLLAIFYNQQELQFQTTPGQKVLVEVWMSGEGLYYRIRTEFMEKDSKLELHSTLLDENGQTICLPETMMIGDYLFRLKHQAFLQGGIVEWPENDHYDTFARLVRNLRQGGDEELSLKKVRASIAGAQKRVEEQKDSMTLVKAEYDALRFEWETAHRHQEEERLLEIEIKNLEEKLIILDEKILLTADIQKRLEILSQNPDYRELRHLNDEIEGLEERLHNIETNLKTISSETHLNWTVIEGLREEFLEWGCLQNSYSSLVTETQTRSNYITGIQNLLQTSGYHGLAENEDQRLRQAEEERDTAQKKLRKLLVKRRGLIGLEFLYYKKCAHLQKLSVMADVTEVENHRIDQKEKRLEWWRYSKPANYFDRLVLKPLGLTTIAERLANQLLQNYKQYNVTNYQEFIRKLKEYHDLQKRVKGMKKQMERLQDKISQESHLRRIVDSRNKLLKQAFTAVQAADFSQWLKGWEDYQRKKHQLFVELDELHRKLEQQMTVEKKLAESAEFLRQRLNNWGIPTEDREEAFSAVINVANQLQERDDIQREHAALSERLHNLLGDRNIVELGKSLEPIAELERESCLSNDERRIEMSAWYKEQDEIRDNLVVLKQRLRSNRNVSSLSVLEKKIDEVKRRWTAYEDLRHALVDARELLELSWQEWQKKHGKTLGDEKQWIYDHCFYSETQSFIEETSVKREYFSYRMAVAQLALSDTIDLPLIFSVRQVKNEDLTFWEEITNYLQKFSFSRQVIFCENNSNLRETLAGRGWFILGMEC